MSDRFSVVVARIDHPATALIDLHSARLCRACDEHDPTIDVRDGIPGYSNIDRSETTFEDLTVRPGIDSIMDPMKAWCDALIDIDMAGAEQRPSLAIVFDDMAEAVRK